MNFSINPQKYGSVFVVPAELADKYLKLCSASFLRVLLVLYRRAPEPLEAGEIASLAGVSAEEAADALEFWESEGYALSPQSAPQSPQPAEVAQTASAAAEPEVQTAPAVKKAKIKPSMPSFKQIHDRLMEDENVRTLFAEAQDYLGRTIGTADQGSLLLLYDFYGLPVDIIMMLCGYASAQGKSGNMRYIVSMGEDWSEREIDTDEKAQTELKRLESADGSWSAFRRVTGIRSPNPTKSQREFLCKWCSDYGFSAEMLGIAFEKMSEHTQGMSFSYMDKILARWHGEGIKTPADVEKSEAEFEKQRAEKAEKRQQGHKSAAKTEVEGGFNTTEASYDIEKANEQALMTPATHKKRRKAHSS